MTFKLPVMLASYGGPVNFAHKLNKYASDWKATGSLSFLNKWSVVALYL